LTPLFEVKRPHLRGNCVCRYRSGTSPSIVQPDRSTKSSKQLRQIHRYASSVVNPASWVSGSSARTWSAKWTQQNSQWSWSESAGRSDDHSRQRRGAPARYLSWPCRRHSSSSTTPSGCQGRNSISASISRLVATPESRHHSMTTLRSHTVVVVVIAGATMLSSCGHRAVDDYGTVTEASQERVCFLRPPGSRRCVDKRLIRRSRPVVVGECVQLRLHPESSGTATLSRAPARRCRR
jgi:hypothetical protein